jgi:hypothetical protein
MMTIAEISTSTAELTIRSPTSSPTGKPVGDGVAEVAGEQPAQPLEVADDDRLVQVQLGGECGGPLRAGGVVLAQDRATGSPSAAVAKKTSTEQSHSVRIASPTRRASHFSQAEPDEPVRRVRPRY